MPEAFEILSRFLERYDNDVEGRSTEEPAADVQRQLKRFATGELSEAERSEVARLLHANPQWVPLLAREVRALRANPATQ